MYPLSFSVRRDCRTSEARLNHFREIYRTPLLYPSIIILTQQLSEERISEEPFSFPLRPSSVALIVRLIHLLHLCLQGRDAPERRADDAAKECFFSG